ncbi:MAG: tetratricopeptide repeat protein [Bdellovibrionales bacterium]
MAKACATCGRNIETYIEASAGSNCLLCLSQREPVLPYFLSMSPGGSSPCDHQVDCGICSRKVNPGEYASKSDYGHVCHSCIEVVQANIGGPLREAIGPKSPKWLLKSSLSVEGPLSSDQISTGLRSRTYSPIDEIIAPRSHWGYIREEDNFEKILDEFGDSDLMPTRTVDVTKSITSSVTLGGSAMHSSKTQSNDVAGYTSNNSQPVSKSIMQLVIAVLVLIIGFYFVTKNKMLESKDLRGLELARVYYEIGDFESSLNSYKTIYSVEKETLNSKDLSKMVLMLPERGESNLAQVILDTLTMIPDSDRKVLQAKIEFLNGNLLTATQYLKTALQISPQNSAARLNFAYLSAEIGDYKNANQAINWKFNTREQIRAQLFIQWKLMVQSNLSFSFNEKKRLRQELIRNLDDLQLSSFMVALLAEDSSKESVTKVFLQGANLPLKYYENFRYEPKLLWHLDRWKTVKEVLGKRTEMDSRVFSALMAILANNVDDSFSAKEWVDKAYAIDNDSDFINTLRSLIRNGFVDQADLEPLTAKLPSSVSNLKAYQVLDFCVSEKDLKCINNVGMKLLRFDRKHLFVSYYLARDVYENDPSKSSETVAEALGEGPSFVPLLRLERELLTGEEL